MKTIKSSLLLLILSSLFLAPAALARFCSYARMGDFAVTVNSDGEINRINLDTADDQTGCPGKQYCDGQMMCNEDDGSFTFKDVHCLAQGDGRCPRAFDCDADQKKSKLGVVANYDGKGVPKNLSPAESDPDQVGTQCGSRNSDLGVPACKSFCGDRCAKFLAATPDKIATCVTRVAENCRRIVTNDAPSGNQAGGR